MFLDHFGIVPGKPDAELLHRIVASFSAIPWENLSKYLVKLDKIDAEERLRLSEVVIGQHIDSGTGGTCFSLTEALGAILEFTGFRAAPVMADMSHGANIHCALSVITPDGRRYLADPGYLIPLPVELRTGNAFRLGLAGETLIWKPLRRDVYDLVTVDGDRETWRYRVRMKPVTHSEFISHWTASFDATGMNSLHANLRSENGRISAHNMNLRLAEAGERINRKLRRDYGGLIQEYFGIDRSVALRAEEEWRRSCLDRRRS
jgi:arylamine N-acetyltransferase